MENKREVQIIIEETYAKNNLMKRMLSEFKDNDQVDLSAMFQNIGITEKFGYSLLVQMALHKRASIETLVGVLRDTYETIEEILTALEISLLAGLVLFDPNTEMFIVSVDVSKETQHDLDLYQYPIPMIVEPKQVRNNREYGYLTFKGSVILKNNHHDNDVNLTHLNRMNKIKLCINSNTANFTNLKWKGLDTKKEDESLEDYRKRIRAFDKYVRDSHYVMGIVGDEPFWLTHRYDKRGRTYCSGYHINYQGADWNKAVVEFAEEEIIPLD